MRQTYLFLFLLLLPLGGCDSNEPGSALLGGISYRSVHNSYQVIRQDSRTTGIRIETVFKNDSERTVYLDANAREVLVYRVQKLIDSSWEDLFLDITVKACGGCTRRIVVQPGEELFLNRGISSSYVTTPQGERWGEQNVSGTYRVGLGVYLKDGDDPNDLSGLLSDTNRFTKAFVLSDAPDS